MLSKKMHKVNYLYFKNNSSEINYYNTNAMEMANEVVKDYDNKPVSFFPLHLRLFFPRITLIFVSIKSYQTTVRFPNSKMAL